MAASRRTTRPSSVSVMVAMVAMVAIAAGSLSTAEPSEFAAHFSTAPANGDAMACVCDLAENVECTSSWASGARVRWTAPSVATTGDMRAALRAAAADPVCGADPGTLIVVRDARVDGGFGDRQPSVLLSSVAPTRFELDARIVYEPRLAGGATNATLARRLREGVKVQLDPPRHLSSVVPPDAPDRNVTFVRMGTGTIVYVVDTRVEPAHEEFVDMFGADATARRAPSQSFASPVAGEFATLSCGAEHGTHVASLVAGVTSGIAKDAQVVSVAVQPGCGAVGTVADLMQGLDWILRHYGDLPEPRPPAIATMSLLAERGGASGSALASAIEELVAAGITVVSAAGNFGYDACHFLPAGLESVVTVGSVDDALGVWPMSNSGECVDVWAPGVDVVAASPACPLCTATYSGTSQATPLVAGALAVRVQDAPRELRTPSELRRWIRSDEGSRAVENVGRVLNPWRTSPPLVRNATTSAGAKNATDVLGMRRANRRA